MKIGGSFLSCIVLLGLSTWSDAATATWSEEMTFEPNADPDHPNRWGVCTGEAAPSPYSSCPIGKFPNAVNLANAITATGGNWQYDGSVAGDISHGMGILDGPLGSSRPSPIAGAAKSTVEFKFRSTTLLDDMLDQPTPEAWNHPITVNSDSSGNVPWNFRYGLRHRIVNQVLQPRIVLELHVNESQADANAFVHVPEETLPYDDQWHVARVIQDFTGNQLTGAGSSGYIDFYVDNVLMKKIPSDTHTFNLANNNPANVTRNRTFGIGQDNQGGGSSSLPFEMDYLRMANSVVPIGEPLNAPVAACGGDVSGSTPGVPDGTTDGADVAYLFNHWGAVPVGTLGDIAGSTGPDGVVDGADLGKVFNCWAQADGGPAPVVPEPASIGILGLGLVGLLAARRRS